MEIVELGASDNLLQVIKKCNTNFKQLAFTAGRSIRKQSRIDNDIVSQAISDVVDNLTTYTIPNEVTSQISAADIPQQVADAIVAQDIPSQIGDAVDAALSTEITSTLADFFTEDGCTVTACQAIRWGNIAFIRFSYRLNSALTVPSNGDITDVTLGRLKIGWRPADMTNVILDQTRILIGDVDSSGAVQARSANSRGTSYTIDANAVLYASMTLMLGIQ